MVTRNEPAWLSWHHSTLFWLIWLQIKFEKNRNNNNIPWFILLCLNKRNVSSPPRKDQLLPWNSLSKAVTCDSQINQEIIYSYLNLPNFYCLFSICFTIPILGYGKEIASTHVSVWPWTLLSACTSQKFSNTTHFSNAAKSIHGMVYHHDSHLIWKILLQNQYELICIKPVW